MKTVLIYHFDGRTGQLLGSGLAEPCQVMPGAFLLPAFSTRAAPPVTTPAGHVAFFDPQTDAWELRPPGVEPPASPAPALTLKERKARLEAAVDLHLDSQARALGYSSIQTSVSYAEEKAVPKFQLEGRALRRWRSLVYARCYELLTAFEAGAIEEPTVKILIDALPAFEMPTFGVVA